MTSWTTRTTNESSLTATNQQQSYQTLVIQSLGRAALAGMAAFCLYPEMYIISWSDLIIGFVATVPLIYLLPVSHQDWRLQPDALLRLYGSDASWQSVGPKMGFLSVSQSIQAEVVFRFLLFGGVCGITGPSFAAMVLSSVLYSRRTSLERFVEGIWYSGLFSTGTLSLSGLILVHGLLDWHRGAVCWNHVVRQLKYVEATASATGGNLRRFFFAHDSRDCGKLNAHDMRRALEYMSQGRISKEELEGLSVCNEFEYDEFEAKLKDLYANGEFDR